VLVDARGVRINVVDRGSGEPVVFLSGVGCSSRSWEPQLRALAATRRVVAVDHRGHGLSDRPSGRMSLRDYADDVLAVMSALAISRAPVVGISMGGMVAQAMALSAPERVAGLVLAATCARADAEMAANMRATGAAALAHGMKATAESVRPVTFSAAAIAENQPHVREFAEQFATTDPYAFSIAMNAIAELDVLDDLPRLDVPTLVLVGAEDVLIPPEYAKAIASAVPGAELHVIDGAGHLCNLDCPEAFTDHLVRFLAA
jgi:3-oxoadipate enol-lactonase